jgi:membrane carboxypeptidase/penicillin-binding protein
LDLSLNDAATSIMRERLAQLREPNDGQPQADPNANNAALVAIHPKTGEILAMVGSPNYFDAQISGAVNAATSLRQPGSAIKPITYAAAFARLPGFTAATPLFDVRTAFPTREGLPYVPVNYDRRHHGPISVRAALATSNNVAAVSVLQQVGLDAMLTQANALGLHSFKSADDYGLSLTLGGGEVRLLELTTAYAVFANAGNRVNPHGIVEVRVTNGELLFTRNSSLIPHPSSLDPKIAWLISDILNDNTARAPAFGEGSVLRLSRPAAVKTGTTTDYRDNWTVGYTPDLVTGVWVGNADGAPMQNISGVSGAGPIWHDFMEAAHRGKPVTWFARPEGLRSVQVCALSGLLPTPACPHTRAEWFIAGTGTEPTQPDTWHVGNQLNLPVPLREWAREQGWNMWRDEGGGMRDEGDLTLIPHPSSLITLVLPDDGSIFRISKALPLQVQRIPLGVAVDEREVVRVDIVLSDGEVIAAFSQAPFTAVWPMRPGEFLLTARATLRNGNVITSQPVKISVLE